ncbi:hypothetical protein RXV86_21665 [Alisedimentitalea sp. MJ-SS2]|uniref:hypothetical protein n=1 Tax=Aliisedimentitalea sp. MJ-SS2 TaxID=3049795 RepID=UPI00290FF957|nr:hypothetical protein [Alisedimentitalea sp. MJ-SS2]MDU8930002.1 hypothetical protein [Alisedimentitalea sp. MJ-SS2]
MRIFAAATLAATLLAPTANAYTAINGLTVNPVANGYEVIARAGSGPRQFWCAAAQYARAKGAGPTQRVYISKGYGPSTTQQGRRAVTYTIAPSGALLPGTRPGDNGNYSVSIRTPGFNLSVGHAEGFCSDVWEELTERWPFH